jgi:4-hydroxythreonine-4-phosphate dehydrogenase
MTLRLALTPGEPSGVGPDILINLVQQGCDHELVAYADPAMLQARAAQLGIALKLRPPSNPPQPLKPNELAYVAVELAEPATPGTLNKANARYVLNSLDAAIAACQSKFCHGMVTGPVQKSIINEAGVAFSGHTEYLAERTATPQVVMMLATTELRVALATTHLPLRDVADSITQSMLRRVLTILLDDLQHKFNIPAPTVLVCGLNPHAGEGGHLGHEEIEIITPVCDEFRTRGVKLVGPLPADTLFTSKYLDHADAVLAMYHDQGLPVLKYLGFGRAANITLGLPIIRTSVDHGTALDLAGTGSADSGSLLTAIHVAATMALQTNNAVTP